jgi:hypothetical protein
VAQLILLLAFCDSSHNPEAKGLVQTSYAIEKNLNISPESSSRFRKSRTLSIPDECVSSAESAEPKSLERKCSAKWWKLYWDNTIKRIQVPRIVYGGIGLLIVVTWIVFT